jgi:hypothetical protein
MAKTDEAVTIIKTIDEHPLVIALRSEVETLKRQRFEAGEEHRLVVQKRDEKYVADGVELRRQILSLQNEIAALQNRLLAIRTAAL